MARGAAHRREITITRFITSTRPGHSPWVKYRCQQESPCPRDAFRPLTSSAGGTNILILRLASVSALKFEAIYKEEKSKTGRVAAIIEGKIMNLSIEAKVAIAVATGLVVLIVGAMAQG